MICEQYYFINTVIYFTDMVDQYLEPTNNNSTHLGPQHTPEVSAHTEMQAEVSTIMKKKILNNLLSE